MPELNRVVWLHQIKPEPTRILGGSDPNTTRLFVIPEWDHFSKSKKLIPERIVSIPEGVSNAHA